MRGGQAGVVKAAGEVVGPAKEVAAAVVVEIEQVGVEPVAQAGVVCWTAAREEQKEDSGTAVER